jgi:protein SCO1/2
MGNRFLAALVVILSLALGWVLWGWQPVDSLAAPPKGGDFTLQSADGPVALHDFRGKVVLVYFGYTFCPDVCPTSLGYTAQALSSLSKDELERVRVLFISVDPGRDTPAKLKEYATFFHPNIIGLTGSPAEVARVARLYGASFAIQKTDSAGGYVVDHSAALYLVGPDGHLKSTLSHGTPPAEMVAAIRKILAER